MRTQKQAKQFLSEYEKRLKVYVGIRFGNPKYEDCRNFGICKLEMVEDKHQYQELREQTSRAWMVKEKRHMKLFFEKKSMTKNTKQKQFSANIFLIEKEKKLSATVARNLGETQIILHAGEFRVRNRADFLVVEIPFSK